MRFGKCRICHKEIKKDEPYWKLTAGTGCTHVKCQSKSSLGDWYTNYYINGKSAKKEDCGVD